MGNNIREGHKVTLTDGKEYEIFPVSLRNLRKLNKTLASLDFTNDAVDDETIDKMVEAAAIILATVDKDLAGDLEQIEDLVDIVAFNKMVEYAMGADPNA